VGSIQFFSEEIEFNLSKPDKVKSWIKKVIEAESKILTSLNFIFCSDEYLHKINTQFLNRDYYTDVITFDYSEKLNEIEGEVYISVARVQENSLSLQQDYHHEIRRVLIHGVLHLLGFNDSSDIEQLAMRKKEEACLSLLDQ